MKLFMLVFVLFLSACGQDVVITSRPVPSPSPAPQMGCSVTKVDPCSAAPEGGSLIKCPDGTQSLVVNGTQVVPVQFCLATTTYPSTFSEVGFCIDGSLYAVYSTNSGFMTEIPPGTYSSDGVNSSCTFTVSANCKVSN